MGSEMCIRDSGLISMVTPIPGGTLLITVGGGMVVCSSERAANYIRRCRAKYVRLNKTMTWLENKMGEKMSAPLRGTRPTETLSVDKKNG